MEINKLPERDEPKAPFNNNDNKGYRCPCCNNVVSEYNDYGFKPKLKKFPYCKFCGQRLDWSKIRK